MDDQFFASVLKKWAHSSQEVVDLKKRLGRLEREPAPKRNEYKYDLKSGDGQETVTDFTPSRTPENAALDLDEVGYKLEIARSEYQRRLKELKDARSHKEALGYEVQELKRERAQLQSQLRNSQEQCAELTSELSKVQLKVNNLTTQVDKASAGLEQAAVGIGTANAGHVANLQERMTSLEEQLEVLQSLTQNLEHENAALREELDTTRGSLHKTKEANKGLRMAVNQLSRVARNVAGVPEPLPGRTSTPKLQRHAVFERSRSPAQLHETLEAEHRSTERPKDDVSFSDLTIVAELQIPSCSMSPHRLEALASLPVITPETEISEEDNKFTRGLTSAAVGNSIYRTISDAATKGRPPIDDYLCPRLDHNPWCPSTPGRHGYIFVSAGKEKHLYTSPHLCNLFVGLPKRSNKEERFFRYLGVYKASCVEPLSVAEWQSLPPELKQDYIHATKEKNKEPLTEQEVAAAYGAGKLVVSCVKLQCIEFDEELYAGLLKFRAVHAVRPRSRTSKRTRCDTDTSGYSQKTLRGTKRSVS